MANEWNVKPQQNDISKQKFHKAGKWKVYSPYTNFVRSYLHITFNQFECKVWCVAYFDYLTAISHWGRVTHICVSKLTIIGSVNGLSRGRRQAGLNVIYYNYQDTSSRFGSGELIVIVTSLVTCYPWMLPCFIAACVNLMATHALKDWFTRIFTQWRIWQAIIEVTNGFHVQFIHESIIFAQETGFSIHYVSLSYIVHKLGYALRKGHSLVGEIVWIRMS